MHLNVQLGSGSVFENPSLLSTRTLANTHTHDSDGRSNVPVTGTQSIFLPPHSMLELKTKRKSLVEEIFFSFLLPSDKSTFQNRIVQC